MSGSRRSEALRCLARIEGYLYGIRKMLQEGRPYSEVVQQISAIRSALDSVNQVIVDELVEECVVKGRKNEDLMSLLSELKQVVARSR